MPACNKFSEHAFKKNVCRECNIEKEQHAESALVLSPSSRPAVKTEPRRNSLVLRQSPVTSATSTPQSNTRGLVVRDSLSKNGSRAGSAQSSPAGTPRQFTPREVVSTLDESKLNKPKPQPTPAVEAAPTPVTQAAPAPAVEAAPVAAAPAPAVEAEATPAPAPVAAAATPVEAAAAAASVACKSFVAKFYNADKCQSCSYAKSLHSGVTETTNNKTYKSTTAAAPAKVAPKKVANFQKFEKLTTSAPAVVTSTKRISVSGVPKGQIAKCSGFVAHAFQPTKCRDCGKQQLNHSSTTGPTSTANTDVLVRGNVASKSTFFTDAIAAVVAAPAPRSTAVTLPKAAEATSVAAPVEVAEPVEAAPAPAVAQSNDCAEFVANVFKAEKCQKCSFLKSSHSEAALEAGADKVNNDNKPKQSATLIAARELIQNKPEAVTSSPEPVAESKNLALNTSSSDDYPSSTEDEHSEQSNKTPTSATSSVPSPTAADVPSLQLEETIQEGEEDKQAASTGRKQMLADDLVFATQSMPAEANQAAIAN